MKYNNIYFGKFGKKFRDNNENKLQNLLFIQLWPTVQIRMETILG